MIQDGGSFHAETLYDEDGPLYIILFNRTTNEFIAWGYLGSAIVSVGGDLASEGYMAAELLMSVCGGLRI